jgi:CubicO group peptidase (beta-lactamase class C family)
VVPAKLLSFCCLNARLRDYAKIGRLAARHGDWDGQRIVSADWLAESTRVEPARAPGTLPHLRDPDFMANDDESVALFEAIDDSL